MSSKLFLVGVLSVVVLAACGGGSHDPNNLAAPVIQSFSASPANLPSGGGTVTLSWSVSGASNISIDQGVGDVTSVSSNSKAISVTSSKTFSLTATNAKGSSSQQASVTVPATIKVTGKVVADDGKPLAGVPVVILGKATAIADAAGSFSIDDVTAPYDITVLDSPDKIATTYKGLTRTDPTLFAFWSSSGAPSRHAAVSGTLSGGTYPQPALHFTQVLFSSPDTTATTSTTGTTPNYTWSSLSWNGPVSTTGRLSAMQVRTVGGLPAEYKGFGKRDNVTITDGGSFTAQNFSMSAVSGQTMSGNIAAPGGYNLDFRALHLNIAPKASMQLLFQSSNAASFSYLAPNIPATTLTLYVQATKSGVSSIYAYKSGLAANATGVNVTLPAPPEANTPAAAATGVNTASSFSWSAMSGSVYYLDVWPSGTGIEYVVVTSGTSATIPDLSTVGFGLPHSAGYKWDVTALAPFASVDAAAVPSFPDAVDSNDLSVDSAQGYSYNRTFTTSP
jgi:hypothetical protein